MDGPWPVPGLFKVMRLRHTALVLMLLAQHALVFATQNQLSHTVGDSVAVVTLLVN